MANLPIRGAMDPVVSVTNERVIWCSRSRSEASVIEFPLARTRLTPYAFGAEIGSLDRIPLD
jgi:hypothetical protein